MIPESVMTPEHPRWVEFYNRLNAAVGSPEQSRCRNDHRHAAGVLLVMDIEVDRSLLYFEEHGGCCDCEILMNVGNRLDDDDIESILQPEPPPE